MPFLKTEDPAMEVFPMVNNSDGANWVGDIVGFLNNPGRSRTFPAAGRAISVVRPLSRPDDRLRSLSSQRPGGLCRAAAGVVGRSARARHEALRRGTAAQQRIQLSGDRRGGRRRGAHELRRALSRRRVRPGGVAGLVRAEPEIRQDRHPEGKNHLRHRQLWLRLGVEAEEGRTSCRRA